MGMFQRENFKKTNQTRFIVVLGCLLVLAFISQTIWALEVPALKGRVNDYGNLISPNTEQQLESLLADLERTDGTQVVILTVPSLKGDSLEDFSIRTAEKWGIGQKGNDNGAILLVSKNDRKIRMEVGYGLEGKLTDLMAGRIIRDIISPRFKNGQFDQGFLDGVSAMVGTVRGEFTAKDIKRPSTRKHSSGSPSLMGLFAFLILLQVVSRISRPLGAAVGGILAPIVGGLFFGAGLMVILFLIPIGIGAGLMAGLFGSLSSGHRGGYSGGGGFSSGGGFGGFSGGGGGFGGGGASGGW